LKNDRGELIKQAPPSTPVQILGLKAAPQVGDILRVAPDELKELKKKVKSHQLGHHLRTVVSRIPVVIRKKSDEDSDEAKPVIKKYFLIIKTDTLGSAEAILESLKRIQHQEVAVEVVQRGLGIISEADVLRAEAAKATVYGFHVPTSPKADELGRNKGVAIKSFKVIYDLIDDITAALEKLLVPLTEEKEIGRLKVMAVFRNENTFQVVGGKVIDGQVALGSFVDIMRGQNIVTHGTLTQLQSNKQNVKEVMSGNEAGLKIESEPIIRVGDIVVCKIREIKQRHLSDQV